MFLSRKLESPWENQCDVTLNSIVTFSPANGMKSNISCSDGSWLYCTFPLIYKSFVCFVRALPFSPVTTNPWCHQGLHGTAPVKRRRFTAVLLACPHPWIPVPCWSTAWVVPMQFVLLWQVLAFGSIPSKQAVAERWRLGSKSESQLMQSMEGSGGCKGVKPLSCFHSPETATGCSKNYAGG